MVKILTLNIFKTDDKIVIYVGFHKIKLSCVNRSWPDERDYSEVIKLEAKHYHEYLVRCVFYDTFGPNGTYTGSFVVKENRIKK